MYPSSESMECFIFSCNPLMLYWNTFGVAKRSGERELVYNLEIQSFFLWVWSLSCDIHQCFSSIAIFFSSKALLPSLVSVFTIYFLILNHCLLRPPTPPTRWDRKTEGARSGRNSTFPSLLGVWQITFYWRIGLFYRECSGCTS